MASLAPECLVAQVECGPSLLWVAKHRISPPEPPARQELGVATRVDS